MDLHFVSPIKKPNPEMLALAKTAQDWFVNPWRDGHQTGCYVNAAMAGVTQKETLRLKLGGLRLRLKLNVLPP